MLKKEHISCKINSGRIKPQFIIPDTPEALECAAALLTVFRGAAETAMSKAELQNIAKITAESSNSPKLGAALTKLLLDRCSFVQEAEFDYMARRRELFLISAENFKKGLLIPPQEECDIYGDLPGFEKLSAFASLTPEELIELYNLSQAQALLIYASTLDLKLTDPDVSALRKVMKAVKFFRLLATFSSDKKNVIKISISGPFALFGPSKKYAVALASLLPVIVTLKQWTLEAVVCFRNHELKLKLDEKSGLNSPKRSFSTFVPEEIKLYHRHFAEKSADWKIVGDTPFINAGNQEIIFPDLSFARTGNGKSIQLELFHRWHRTQFFKRIELLKKNPDIPLIIGIDRAVIKEDELDDLLNGFPQLRMRCWLFSEFPGVENTLRVLKKTAAIFQQ